MGWLREGGMREGEGLPAKCSVQQTGEEMGQLQRSVGRNPSPCR